MENRCLLITREYPPDRGGVAEYYRGLVEHMPSDMVNVMTPVDDELGIKNKELGSREGVPVMRRIFTWKLWPRWGRLVVSLITELRRERYAWVWVGQVLPIGTAVLISRFIVRSVYRFSRHSGTPPEAVANFQLLVFTHGMDVTALRGRRRWLARMIFQRADLVIANSQWTKNALLLLGVDKQKIHVLTPCPAVAHTQPKFQIPNSSAKGGSAFGGKSFTRPLILAVGRLVARKGFDTVIEVFARVQEHIPRCQLAIIGDGPERSRLEALARRHGIDPQSCFMGALESAAIAQWYARASVVLFLPRDNGGGDVESFGMVVLEAHAYGVPVVASRSGGVGETLEDGVNGFLVEPGDVSGAAEKVMLLMRDATLAERFGREGHARVKRDFQWQARAHRIMQLCALA